jgi:hypothetical protein
MMALVFAAFFGLLLGFFVIGPVNRTYSAMQFGLIVGVLTGMVGLLFLAALVLNAFFFPSDTPSTTNPVIGTAIASGAWASYAASVGLGAYLQQRFRGGR